MKNDYIRIAIFFIAGLAVGSTGVFIAMQQTQRQNQREAAVMLRTTLASSRLSALKTLRDEDVDALAAELETSLEGDRAALEAVADPDRLELMLLKKIAEYRKEYPFTSTADKTDGDE
ncbi:MAG: hypothetical protein AB7F32_12270 [Victivallaceae bacterium]